MTEARVEVRSLIEEVIKGLSRMTVLVTYRRRARAWW